MVYIILGRGFEEMEAIVPGDILRRGREKVKYAAIDTLSVVGLHDITIVADMMVDDVQAGEGDYIVLPGGLPGVETIRNSEVARKVILDGIANGAKVAAICAAPSILADLGLIDGKNITCYPGCEAMMGNAFCNAGAEVCDDNGIITGRSAGTAIPFGLALLDAVAPAKIVGEAVRKSLAL